MFQFTPARGGRLSRATCSWSCSHVSIHARAWRATTAWNDGFCGTRFNSRPRVAGDSVSRLMQIRLFVSIHARAWRATCPPSWVFRQDTGFNSRPRVAGDEVKGDTCAVFVPVSIHARAWRATMGPGIIKELTMFQFTPARGGRPNVSRHVTNTRLVSIHARAWRATFRVYHLRKLCFVSIHARAWRATHSVV